MSLKSVLVASIFVSFAAPAAAQIHWEGGQPQFRNAPPAATGRVYSQERRYFQEPRRGDFDRRWRGYERGDRWDYWGWGYEPRQRAAPRGGPDQLAGGPRPNITPRAPERVAFANNETAGTIIIDSEARKLYYTLSSTEAYAYPVSVGREGFDWTGTETITRVASWPNWHPPAEMRQRQPELPRMMTGGLRNPLGAKALYLGDTLYRIHGTNDERTLGEAASSGCFRMMNEHVVHLAEHAGVGTKVRVVKRWPAGGMAAIEPAPEADDAPVDEAAAEEPEAEADAVEIRAEAPSGETPSVQ